MLNYQRNILFFFSSKEEIDLQLRITFYDAANNYFFGSTWIGPILKSEIVSPGKHIVEHREVNFLPCYSIIMFKSAFFPKGLNYLK